jgi:hypothetical protein
MTLSLIVIIVSIVLIFLAGLNLFIYITEHDVIPALIVAMICTFQLLVVLVLWLCESLK